MPDSVSPPEVLPLPHVAGKIAHDFNNTLIIMMGAVDLFDLDLPADSPLRIELDALRDAVERAKTLTANLSAAARHAREGITPSIPQVTLLLIEPAPYARHVAKQSLERLGYNVLAAATNEEGDAISAAHAGPVHRLPAGTGHIAIESFASERLAEVVRTTLGA